MPSKVHLQGRLLAIRKRTANTDECHTNAYFPPSTTPGAQDTVRDLCDEIGKVIRELPSRTTPFLFCDANTQFGVVSHAWGEQVLDDPCLGGYNLGKENAHAEPIRRLLNDHGLILVSTTRPLPPICFWVYKN